MKERILLLGVLLISLTVPTCKNNPTEPPLVTVDYDHYYGVLANKLLSWSDHQPAAFVIWDGGDLITNISLDVWNLQWIVQDSLFIDTTGLKLLKIGLPPSRLPLLVDSITNSLTEQQMNVILGGLGYRMRMMNYDSLTYALSWRMLAWAKHQFPPKTLGAGAYGFVEQGPNAGGWSSPWLKYPDIQNLQYFTRTLDKSSVTQIVTSLDTSLSFQQLQSLFSPIAPLEEHDTFFGIE
jgi:hypothetical protein